MGLISIIISIIFVVNQVLPYKLWGIGNFYIENEGFFPKNFENEYVKYESCLEPLKDNYHDKRMYGIFVLKRKLENLGATSQMHIETSVGGWQKASPLWTMDSICNTGYSIGFLEESFTGRWDEETCSMEAGSYFLRNYTMENDIKNATNGRFPYGHYNITGTLLADIEGHRTTVAVVYFLMHIKDEKNKQTKSGKHKQALTCKKYY